MKQNFSKKENQEFIRYNNYINQIFSSKIIFSNHIGWDYIIKGNDIFCLINSGYYNNDKNIFSFHRTKETNNYIILPLLFHLDLVSSNVNIYTFDTTEEIPKIDIYELDSLINNSICIKKIHNAYFDIYMKPLSEIKLLEILYIEKRLRE